MALTFEELLSWQPVFVGAVVGMTATQEGNLSCYGSGQITGKDRKVELINILGRSLEIRRYDIFTGRLALQWSNRTKTYNSASGTYEQNFDITNLQEIDFELNNRRGRYELRLPQFPKRAILAKAPNSKIYTGWGDPWNSPPQWVSSEALYAFQIVNVLS